ncbi:RrF2 family transcriptional regulator [Pelagicoccus albus]|uniref:Rrf2 family transcriptional regulator n=1 Tax=Pelagicoccus albus TaxID=415222 RepID=A0A7X1B2Y8_9BACT|nr:Rrf2 family transcriptional regulator [Pelagicoccus albus]MBC2604691.1 Rrf2 family transcriptional regulator [Pelagicoccus albus]
MELTKFSDYSLRTLIYLGINEERVVPLLEISEAYSISRNTLAKISNFLSQHEVIISSRGNQGGVRLAKAAEDINIGTLVRKTESHIPLVECFASDGGSCCINKCCTLKGVLRSAENAFYKELEKYSLADLITGKSRIREAFGIG